MGGRSRHSHGTQELTASVGEMCGHCFSLRRLFDSWRRFRRLLPAVIAVDNDRLDPKPGCRLSLLRIPVIRRAGAGCAREQRVIDQNVLAAVAGPI
jgi:hypothetical protein